VKNFLKSEIENFKKLLKYFDKKVFIIFISVAVLQTISWYFTSRDFFRENFYYNYFSTNQSADLYDVLERLPEGLKTNLGEGGGLVSGGEGQRVRLGRAMLRAGVRLVILDEPFRGLDRERRRILLSEARRIWNKKTLLCITHDIGETRNFPRVLVIENGEIVEDAPPGALEANPSSRYRAILAAEAKVRQELWESAEWRRFTIDRGVLLPSNDERPPQSDAEG